MVGIVTTTATPSQTLAEHLLGRPVGEYIAEKRSSRPRWSWRLIAEQLGEDTAGKVVVTAETIRQWAASAPQAVAS